MGVVHRCCLFTVLLAATLAAAAQTPQTYYKDGSDKFVANDYPGAIASFTRAINLEPSYTDAWYFRGMTKFITKDSTAADDFTRVLELDPHKVKAWAYRGMVKHRRRDYASAIADFSRALSLNPRYEEAWFYRGNANMELKNYYAALADFDKAIALRPDYTAAIYTRGLVRFNLQKYADALPDFDKTLTQNPGYSARAWYLRGVCHMKLGHRDQACADLRKAAETGSSEAMDMRKKVCP